MKTLRHVHLYASGHIVVMDDTWVQLAELQKPLILLWAERAESLGYNVDGMAVHMDGAGFFTLHKTESGWNYSIK